MRPWPSATSMARCWQTVEKAFRIPSRLRTTTMGSPTMAGGEELARLASPDFAADAEPFVIEDGFFFEFVKFGVGVAGRRQHFGFVDGGDRGLETGEKPVVENACFHGNVPMVRWQINGQDGATPDGICTDFRLPARALARDPPYIDRKTRI